MKRIVGAVAVGLLAVVLFLGGSIILRPSGAGGRTAPRALGLEDLLRVAAAADVGETISVLKAQVASGGPDVAESRASLALAYLQKARTEAHPASYTAAEIEIERSLAQQPGGNFAATIARAILAGSRHDFHGQLRWSRRAARIEPFDSQARGLIGDALLELGNQRRAVDAYQRSIDLRPDLASFGRVSHAAAALGDTPGAIKAMHRALSFAGASADHAAWAHWQLGELYIGSGRFGAAARHLNEALRLVPDFGSALESTVHLAAARGDIDRAIDIMIPLAQEQPLPGNLVFLGELYLMKGERIAAEEVFAAADRRLELYMQHGVRPDVDFILFWADRKIHRDRAVREGRTLYRERTSGAVSDALGWALHAAGRDDAAMRFAEEAIRRSPQDAGYRFHAGMIALTAGDGVRAHVLLRQALELDPSWSIIDSSAARAIVSDR